MAEVSAAASPAARSRPAGWRGGLALLLAGLWLSCLWSLPTNPHAPVRFALSVEIALLLLVLALTASLRRGAAGRLLRYAAAAATTLVVALKAGELAIRSSLGRPLNPLLDLDLAPSMVHLLAGTLGTWRTGLLLVAAALALLAVFGLSVLAVGVAQRALAGARERALMLAAGFLLLAVFGLGRAAPEIGRASCRERV